MTTDEQRKAERGAARQTEIDEHAKAVAEAMPPLTEDQKTKLKHLLGPRDHSTGSSRSNT